MTVSKKLIIIQFIQYQPREKIYSDLNYEKEDAFIFGPETTGLPQKIIDQFDSIKIPMKSAGRSINLANAVSIIVYEAWRQLEFI